VHPGSARHIDLLHVDSLGGDEADAPLQLDLNPKPTGGQDLLEAGTYEISIEIRARNADALRYVTPDLLGRRTVQWSRDLGPRTGRAAAASAVAGTRSAV